MKLLLACILPVLILMPGCRPGGSNEAAWAVVVDRIEHNHAVLFAEGEEYPWHIPAGLLSVTLHEGMWYRIFIEEDPKLTAERSAGIQEILADLLDK